MALTTTSILLPASSSAHPATPPTLSPTISISPTSPIKLDVRTAIPPAMSLSPVSTSTASAAAATAAALLFFCSFSSSSETLRADSH